MVCYLNYKMHGATIKNDFDVMHRKKCRLFSKSRNLDICPAVGNVIQNACYSLLSVNTEDISGGATLS